MRAVLRSLLVECIRMLYSHAFKLSPDITKACSKKLFMAKGLTKRQPGGVTVVGAGVIVVLAAEVDTLRASVLTAGFVVPMVATVRVALAAGAFVIG